MLSAIFDRMNSSAAVRGAYQYDSGQRLQMYGIPSPDELAEDDDFISGNIVTVQVHFGRRGDSQTEARLALWDDERGCWQSAVPDPYLQEAEDVYAYVYVQYGVDEDGNGRTKTLYELTFRPIARPAPNNVVTNEQWTAWASKKSEVDLALDAVRAAASTLTGKTDDMSDAKAAAETAKSAAQTAAKNAQKAVDRLEEREDFWNGMPIRYENLTPGADAYVRLESGALAYGVPQGAAGLKGDTGNTGPTDIALSMADGVLTITPKG